MFTVLPSASGPLRTSTPSVRYGTSSPPPSRGDRIDQFLTPIVPSRITGRDSARPTSPGTWRQGHVTTKMTRNDLESESGLPLDTTEKTDGPILIKGKEFPQLLVENGFTHQILNFERSHITDRVERVLSRLLSHPRFSPYVENFYLMLTDSSLSAAISPDPGPSRLIQGNPIFFSMDLLRRHLAVSGELNEDQIAFILAHELGHFLFRREKNKDDNYVLNQEEEMVVDVQALELMDDCGYSVHFAGFSAWVEDIGAFTSTPITHPDILWRDNHLHRKVMEKHWVNYRDRSLFPIEGDELEDVTKPHQRLKLQEDLFSSIQDRSEAYPIPAEIKTTEELSMHLMGLIYRAARQEYEERPLLPQSYQVSDFVLGEIFEGIKVRRSYLPEFPAALRNHSDFLNQLGDAKLFKKVEEKLGRPPSLDEKKLYLEQAWLLSGMNQTISSLTAILKNRWSRGRHTWLKDSVIDRFLSNVDDLFESKMSPQVVVWKEYLKRTDWGRAPGSKGDWTAEELTTVYQASPKRMTVLFSDSLSKDKIDEKTISSLKDVFRSLRGFTDSEKWIFSSLPPYHHFDELVELVKTIHIHDGVKGENEIFQEGYAISELSKNKLLKLIEENVSQEEIYQRLKRAISENDQTTVLLFFKTLNDENRMKLVAEFEDYMKEHFFSICGDELAILFLRRKHDVPPQVISKAGRLVYEGIRNLSNPDILHLVMRKKNRKPGSAEPLLKKLTHFLDEFLQAWNSLEDNERTILTTLYEYSFESMNGGLKKIAGWMEMKLESQPSFRYRNSGLILYGFIRSKASGISYAQADLSDAKFKLIAGEFFDDYLSRKGSFFLEASIPKRMTVMPGAESLECINRDLNPMGVGKWSVDRKIAFIKKLLVRFKDEPVKESRRVILLRSLQRMTLEEIAGGNLHQLFADYSKDQLPLYVHDDQFQPKDAWRHVGGNEIQRVRDKVSPEMIPLLLSPRRLHLYITQTLNREELTESQLVHLHQTLRESKICEYKGSLPLDLRERVYAMSAGDYLAFRMMPENLDWDKKMDYFDRVWTIPSDLKDVVIYRAIKDRRISMEEMGRVRKHLKNPDRFIGIMSHIFEEWKKGDVSKSKNALQEKIAILTELFPAGEDRYRMIREESMKHRLRWSDYEMMRVALGEERMLDRNKMFSDHLFMQELNNLSSAEKKRLTALGSGNFNTLPLKIKKKMDEEWKFTESHLRDYLKLPTIRQVFFENILIASKGLLLPEQSDVLQEALGAIWENTFGASKCWSKLEKFSFEALGVIFKHVDIHKKYAVFVKVCQLLFDKKEKKEKVSINDLINVALGAYGPEGAKLGQILSSIEGVWREQPELARMLSDFQDQQDLVSHFDVFESLEKINGDEACRSLRIAAPKRAGSIKGFFTVGDDRTRCVYGLLQVRTQVVKGLHSSEASMKSVVEELSRLIQQTFNGEMPARVVEVVFQMIRREVYLHHENDVLDTISGKELSFHFPHRREVEGLEINPDYQLVLEMIVPNISLKRLLAFEKDSHEWEKMSESEKKIISAILIENGKMSFNHQEFCDWFSAVKTKLRDAYAVMRSEEDYVHVDPHGGNILMKPERQKGVGVLSPYLIDLGAMIRFSPQVRKLEQALFEGLMFENADILNEGISEFSGKTVHLEWGAVFEVSPQFRLFAALQHLEKKGFSVPLEIHEYFLSLPKADQWLFA